MFFRTAILLVVVFCLCFSLQAREIAGVSVAETSNQDGVMLTLNGAGVRTKFFFDIYIAQLYLTKTSTEVAAILAADRPRRLVMHFLYREVDQQTLIESWLAGFAGNATRQQLAQQQTNIEAFNAMFDTVRQGDQIILDYLPGTGTRVIIRGEQQGVVAGKNFNDLLLSIWLGRQPVDQALKDALLGK